MFSQAELVPNAFYFKNVWPTLPHIRMSVPEASILTYWGEKGVASTKLLPPLYAQISLLENKIIFQDKVIVNLQRGQEEYRNLLGVATKRLSDADKLLATSNAKSFEWERKAKNRGETLWAIGGAALAAVIVAVIPKG